MSSCVHVSVTGHTKDPMPLVEKSRASCPSGRFPSSFIHHVIITGLRTPTNSLRFSFLLVKYRGYRLGIRKEWYELFLILNLFR